MIFETIGKLIDGVLTDAVAPEADADDFKKRGAELIVTLWESEFEKFNRQLSASYIREWRHADFPLIKVSRNDLLETRWTADYQGIILPFTRGQRKRIEAVLRDDRRRQEVASVEALAAAIVARADKTA